MAAVEARRASSALSTEDNPCGRCGCIQSDLQLRHDSYQRPNHFEAMANVSSHILHDPHFNKGTAFTSEERDHLKIRGLLPHALESIDVQVKRCLTQFHRFSLPMSKYVYLASLRDRNDTLFYRLVINNLEEMMPFIYTPTVGQACLEFGLQFRQAEGMYFSKDDRTQIRSLLDNWRPNSENEVNIIVVTDGSRILGLGDLGACGMGIPIGKLSLYVAAGGFHPATVLPVVLDCGTNNQSLLEDEFYLGQRHKRLPDDEFYALVEEFVLSVQLKWPNALIQFEDFSNDHCFKLLDTWRDRVLCFNDDIQGTGSVIAAGFLNALKIAKIADPRTLRLVFLGAGSAAIGVADQIGRVLRRRYNLTKEEVQGIFYLMDSKGLVTVHRGDELAEFKVPYARKDITDKYQRLEDVLERVKPHGLIGLSGVPGQFTEAILKRMGELNERPIVFPLSNPTSKSECSFEQAMRNTDSRVIFASGSPFPNFESGEKVFKPSQGNNLYTFPGLGFGSCLCASKTVTDDMIDCATLALADTATEEDLANNRLYPCLSKIRDISARVAVATIQAATRQNLNRNQLPSDPEELLEYVVESMYDPVYLDWEDGGFKATRRGSVPAMFGMPMDRKPSGNRTAAKE